MSVENLSDVYDRNSKTSRFIFHKIGAVVEDLVPAQKPSVSQMRDSLMNTSRGQVFSRS